MATPNLDEDDSDHEDVVLTKPQRIIATLVAGGSFAAGVWATFTVEVEAGPVALIAVGFLAGLIALSGRMPTRLKVGDNEAVWRGQRTVGRILAQAIEDSPQQVRAAQLEDLGRLAETSPRVAGPALKALAFEQEAIGVIQHRCRELASRYKVAIVASYSNDRGFDLVIECPATDSLALVELKHRVSSRSPIAQIMAMMTAHEDSGKHVSALLVFAEVVGVSEQMLKSLLGNLHTFDFGQRTVGELDAVLIEMLHLATADLTETEPCE